MKKYDILMNKSIVMSDSQFLTDPRLQMLMSGYHDIELQNPHNLNRVESTKKDFEKLIQNGLIEVAVRKKNDKKYHFTEIWTGMNNSINPVPYLPDDNGDYATYLDTLPVTK